MPCSQASEYSAVNSLKLASSSKPQSLKNGSKLNKGKLTSEKVKHKPAHSSSASNLKSGGALQPMESNSLVDDSLLIDRIIQDAAQNQEKCLKNVPMIKLLDSYDGVIKSKDQQGKRVSPDQATRIYRKLLKIHRDHQMMQIPIQNFSFVNEKAEEFIDLTQTLSLQKGENTFSTELSNTAETTTRGGTLMSKSGWKKPPMNAKVQNQSRESTASMSLPKLSFSKVLGKAPKPIQSIPQPHPMLEIRAFDSLGGRETERTEGKKNEGNIQVFEDPSDKLKPSSQNDSYYEFTLKPEIAQFSRNNHLMLNEDSSLMMDANCLMQTGETRTIESGKYEPLTAHFDRKLDNVNQKDQIKTFNSDLDHLHDDYIPLRLKSQEKTRKMSKDMQSLRPLENIMMGISIESESRSKSNESAKAGNRIPGIHSEYATLGRAGQDQFERQQLEFNLLECKLQEECKQLELLFADKRAQSLAAEKAKKQVESQGQKVRVSHSLNKERMAIVHHQIVVYRKVLTILVQNAIASRNESMFSKLSQAFRQRRLLLSAFKTLKFYVKELLPEERTIAVATKQFQLLTKIRVFRILRIRAEKKVIQKRKVWYAKRRLREHLLKRLFDNIIQYAASKAIQKSQFKRAKDFRNARILKTSFESLNYFRRIERNLNLIREKAVLISQQNTLSKCFNAIHFYKVERKQKARLNELCEQFLQQSYWPGVKLLVLVALQKVAKKQIKDRRADEYCKQQSLKKFFKIFREAATIQQNYNNQKAISDEIYNLRVQQSAFKMLQDNMAIEFQENLFYQQLKQNKTKMKVVKALVGHKEMNKQIFPMSHHMQLKCAKVWLQSCFGELMKAVWADFPDNRITKLRKVQNGKIEVLLPNYLQVSQQKRFQGFYIQVNNFLAQDALRDCFRNLHINARYMRKLKKLQTFRRLQSYFLAFKQRTLSKAWIKRLLREVKQEKQVLLVKSMFTHLAYFAYTQQRLKLCEKTVAKRNQQFLYSQYLGIWTSKYSKEKRRKTLNALSKAFTTQKLRAKYMALWVHSLKLKLKKRYLYLQVMPKVKTKALHRRLFRAWVALYRKNEFLREHVQQQQLRNKCWVMFKVFEALKLSQETKKNKKQRYESALSRYQYRLVNLGFKHLATYSRHQINKRLLYSRMKADFETKRKIQIFALLQTYTSQHKFKQIEDLIYLKHIQSICSRNLFRKWHRVFQKRASLKFMEVTFDFFLIRKSFGQICNYNSQMDRAWKQIASKKKKHLLKQYFKQLRTHCIKLKLRKCHLELVQVSKKPYIQKRYFNFWQAAFQKRQKWLAVAGWTIVQISKQIQKKYFQAIKQHCLHQKLKRKSPLIAEILLMKRTFNTIRKHQLKRQHCRLAKEVLQGARQTNTVKLHFKLWLKVQVQTSKVKQIQTSKLSSTFQSVWNALCHYRDFKIQTRIEEAMYQEHFELIRRNLAFRKFMYIISEQQEQAQKMVIAECFNNQYTFQACFRAWVLNYRNQKQMIEKVKQVKLNRPRFIKKHCLQAWKRQSWKPLSKLAYGRYLVVFGLRIKVKRALKIWKLQTVELRQSIARAVQFRRKKDCKLLKKTWLAIQERISFKLNLRQRLEISVKYSESKLLEKALRCLKQYKLLKAQIFEQNAVALDKQTSVLQQRIFAIFKYVTQQRRQLRTATSKFSAQKTSKVRLTVFHCFKQNIASKALSKHLQLKQRQFHRYSLLKKGFTSLASAKELNSVKMLRLSQADQFHLMSTLIKFFHMLKENVHRNLELKNKREMMYEVIVTLDIQNLKQRVFDSLFKYLIQVSDEHQNVTQALLLSKKRRVFKIFEWYRDHRKQLQAASALIKQQRLSSLKCKFFYQWRTKFMASNLLQAYLKNKRKHLIKCIFVSIKKHYFQSSKLKLCRKLMNCKTRHLVLNLLKQNVVLKHFKVQQMKQAKAHFDKTIASKSFAKLAQYKSERKTVSLISKVHRNILVVNFYTQWLSLTRLTLARKQSLKRIVKIAKKSKQQVALSAWLKLISLAKMCEKMFQQNSSKNSAQNTYEQKSKAYRSLVRYRNRQVNCRVQFEVVKSAVQSRTQVHCFSIWRSLVKQSLLRVKLNHLVEKTLKTAFQSIKEYSSKESHLTGIEQEVKLERELTLKSKLMTEWLILTFKRRTAMKFMESRLKIKIMQVFEALKQHLIDRSERKLQELQIKACLGGKQVTQMMLTKVFLVDQLVISQDALQKYTFQKWKLYLASQRRTKDKREDSQLFYLTRLLASSFKIWRKNSLLKRKQRQVKMLGNQIYEQNMLRKYFFSFCKATENQKRLNQLKQKGAAYAQHVSQRKKHKHLRSWYSAMIHKLQEDEKYDEIVAQFKQITISKTVRNAFNALQQNWEQKQQTEEYNLKTQQINCDCEDFYHHNLLSKTFKAWVTYIEEEGEYYDLPKQFREQIQKMKSNLNNRK